MYVCAHMSTDAYRIYKGTSDPWEQVWTAHCAYGELNSGPLQAQYVLLTVESSSQRLLWATFTWGRTRWATLLKSTFFRAIYLCLMERELNRDIVYTAQLLSRSGVCLNPHAFLENLWFSNPDFPYPMLKVSSLGNRSGVKLTDRKVC